MAGLSPTWKDISNTVSFVLLFGMFAFKIYQGSSLIHAIMWAGVVFFVFNIISILLTNVMVKVLHDYEMRRMIELAEEEEEAEERAMEEDED